MRSADVAVGICKGNDDKPMSESHRHQTAADGSSPGPNKNQSKSANEFGNEFLCVYYMPPLKSGMEKLCEQRTSKIRRTTQVIERLHRTLPSRLNDFQL